MIRLAIALSLVGYFFFNTSHSEDLREISFKTVNSGDTVYSILASLNFNPEHRRSCLRDDILGSNFVLAPGDIYRVAKTTSTGRKEVKFYDKNALKAYVFWREGKAAGATETRPQLEARTLTIEGEINGSFFESVRRQGGNDQLALRFMDAFHFDFYLPRVVQRGDRFKMEFERLYDGDRFIRYGEVLMAELESRGTVKTRRYFALDDLNGLFVDPYYNFTSRPLYAPVEYIRISSIFQPRRAHPVTGRVQAHLGVDFELPEGAPIYAALEGTVQRKARRRGAGNYVVLKHANGLETHYFHFSEHVDSLSVGDRVKAGQLIGLNGCTGLCTKSHLHFGVKKNGRYVDPMPLLKNHSFSQRAKLPRLIAQM